MRRSLSRASRWKVDGNYSRLENKQANHYPTTNGFLRRRVDDLNLKNSHGLDADGRFSVLVPAVPFTVEVSAPGYQKKELGSIRLKAGEIKHIDILLTPTN